MQFWVRVAGSVDPSGCVCSSSRCAFSNCQHLQEPGCALIEGWSRHPFYVELHWELKAKEDLERHRAASKRRREGTVRWAFETLDSEP